MTFFYVCDNIIIMKEIVKELNKNGYDAFIVGGYVRDYLLGINSTDIDICTNAPIDKVSKIFNGRGKLFKEYFSYHIEEDGYTYNITTFRKEGKYKKNKPIEITKAKDLGTDLLRRDFTINTFAIDNAGRLIDILGAKKDLDSRIIKVVGDTDKKLTEDKTRIIRAIRFACTLDFDLSPEILDFISKKSYYLNEVPKDYKRKELDKIFDSINVDKFFYFIKRFDIAKYFNIKYDKLYKAYNKYGIWAQLETDLPFTKKEKELLSDIRKIVESKDIHLSDLMMYDNEVVYNAAAILKLENKLKTMEEMIKLHSIIDLDITPDLLMKYCKLKDIKRAYKLIERNVMEGLLENNIDEIEMFLRDMKL